MKLTKVDTYTIRGRHLDVFVDAMHQFSADMEGNNYKAQSFDALKKKLQAAAATRKLNIPVTIIENGWRAPSNQLVHATLVGVHSNGNLIINSKGSNQQVHGYEQVYLGFSKHDEENYRALFKAKEDAANAFDQFLSDRRVHVYEAREALEGKGKLAEHAVEKENPVSNTRKVGKKR